MATCIAISAALKCSAMKLSDYIKSDPGRGRQSALCKLIGAHAPDMSRWISGERPIPEPKCALIELYTRGESTCEENRPDIVWARIADANWPHPDGRPAIDLAKEVDTEQQAVEPAKAA